jgi:hypothetical protein
MDKRLTNGSIPTRGLDGLSNGNCCSCRLVPTGTAANRFFGILYHCPQKRISYDKQGLPDIKIATWLLPHVRCLHHGHYELGVDEPVTLRLVAAFDELALTM